MENKFFTSIKNNKISCYFISPHLDDAVLSVGAIMSQLSSVTSVTVINVFTTADNPPYTLSAKAFLKQCNFADARELFHERVIEDRTALSSITDTIIDLGLQDALFRKKQKVSLLSTALGKFIPELNHIYPTYRFHITTGKVSTSDTLAVQTLSEQIQSLPRDSIVFCPMAIGNHVDHVLVRETCLRNFPSVILWSDYPYNLTMEPLFFQHNNEYQKVVISVDEKKKLALMKKYKTQYTALFGDKTIDASEESIYIPVRRNE